MCRVINVCVCVSFTSRVGGRMAVMSSRKWQPIGVRYSNDPARFQCCELVCTSHPVLVTSLFFFY